MLLQERTSTLSRHKYKSHTHTYMRVFWRAFPCASCFQNHQTSPHLLGLPKMSQKVTTDQQQCRSMCLALRILPKYPKKSKQIRQQRKSMCLTLRMILLPNTDHVHFPIPIIFISKGGGRLTIQCYCFV